LWKLADTVCAHFGFTKRPIIISNACISGVSAVITASRLIRSGEYRNVIVVGGDALSEFVVTGFDLFKSLSSNPCRPYDSARDGLNLGEACAALLVTCNKDLSCGVTVEGGAVTNDANHISGPSRTGDGLCYAMEQAMRQSGVTPQEISFVNAHGTATLYNDEMESKAVLLAGLAEVPINSLKSYFGHTLGTAGVVEIIVCAEQLKQGVLLGTKGFEHLGVPAEIQVSGEHKEMKMKRCVKTASGFSGCNAAIVLSLEEHARTVETQPEWTITQLSDCEIENGIIKINGCEVFHSEGEFGEFIRAAFRSFNYSNMKFYKMDDLCKLGYIGAEYLLHQRHFHPSEVALLLSNRSASLDTDRKHQQAIGKNASPAVFVYTLPNIVLGEICIRHKIQGENTFFITEEPDYDFLRHYAEIVMRNGGYKALIYGWCELLGEKYKLKMNLIVQK
ncbi:MAG: beta-ketoacyl synthase N-terminal-like domain-containing protein, partial [Rikenellaceae bacterium]